MTYAWNCSVGAAEAALLELTTQNKQLLSINSQLAQEQQEMAKEMKGTDFLRSAFSESHSLSSNTLLFCCVSQNQEFMLRHNLISLAVPVVVIAVPCSCD